MSSQFNLEECFWPFIRSRSKAKVLLKDAEKLLILLLDISRVSSLIEHSCLLNLMTELNDICRQIRRCEKGLVL